MKSWKSIAGSAVLIALLAETVAAQSPGPIRIGASISLTGSYAKPGAYQKEGYDICAEEVQEAYPKGNTDFSALLVKIKALNPDVIAAGTYFDDAVAITRQVKELNVNPKMCSRS